MNQNVEIIQKFGSCVSSRLRDLRWNIRHPSVHFSQTPDPSVLHILGIVIGESLHVCDAERFQQSLTTVLIVGLEMYVIGSVIETNLL